LAADAALVNGFPSSGVLLDAAPITYSSPAIAEIDGNPANGMEIAVGSNDGKVHVIAANGSVLWSSSIPQGACGRRMSSVLSSPAVGKLYGDDSVYVAIGFGGVGIKRCDGGLAVFRGSDGKRMWVFNAKKYSKSAKFWAVLHSVFSTPAISDTDGDGTLEIGFGSFDRNVYLLNSNGAVRWFYQAADTVWSSPAFASIDGDSRPEMIIGTDISQNKFLKPPTQNGGYVYAFKTNPRQNKSIYFRNAEGYHWQSSFDQVIYSSPVIADVMASNPGNEIIIGSGCFFPQNSRNKSGRWFKILSLKTGALLKTLNAPACSSSAAAVGDLDDDGQLEIVATVNGDKSVGGDGYGRVLAWKPDNSEPIWSVIPRTRGGNDEWLGHFSSPIIADLDMNGSPEVIVTNYGGVSIFNGRDGIQLTCEQRSCDDKPSLIAAGALRTTPAVADLNADGQLDLILAGQNRASGKNAGVFGWTGFSGILNSTPGTQPPGVMPWPMARGNPARTALAE